MFKIEETKTSPFSYFVNKMIAVINKYWHIFKVKFSSEQELEQLVLELEDLKKQKNSNIAYSSIYIFPDRTVWYSEKELIK